MSAEIVWEDPPEARNRGRTAGRRKENAEFVEALKTKPGEWARLPGTRYAGHAKKVREGVIEAFRPAGAFEARWSGQPSQPGTVWIRYVGENQEYGDEGLMWVDSKTIPRSAVRTLYRLSTSKFTSRGDKGKGTFKEWARVPMWFAKQHDLVAVDPPSDR